MRVFVVGSTGVLGRNVIPRLIERGHQVSAVARRQEQIECLIAQGVQANLGDILDADSLTAPLSGCDAALHLATAIPKRGEAWDLSRDAQIRQQGTRNLLDATLHAGVRLYIQQSITFIYGDRGTEITDESTPIGKEFNPAAAMMEEMVGESKLDWCILRGGLFYGPNAGLERGLREDAVNGNLQLPGDGSALLSIVHEVDMARAVVLAAESARAGSIYNVVDDKPVTYKELYSHVATLAGVPAPAPGGDPHLPPLGCSNARLKADLGWSPAYPTYRAGII